MKTLYESILDINASADMEKSMMSGIQRKKLIQNILRPVEDIIKTYHYYTQGTTTTMYDLYGLKGAEVMRLMEPMRPNQVNDVKNIAVFDKILSKPYEKIPHEHTSKLDSSTMPQSRFTFGQVGITISIQNFGIVVVHLAKDKQVEGYVKDLFDKYTD